ncbi:unnamed protein product [Adineta ricciae]|uniref:DUF4371 domain-containing protein n=1 Tax=Adineta ricciae TaxID=249248 RepID=A0A815V2I5_ADIRI|nr:unnamed protein product [Adineta ricciae]CAF1641948.1 unnamed protein product [Adineta ricciae]
MEEVSDAKDPKRGTIESFFSLQTNKKQKSDFTYAQQPDSISSSSSNNQQQQIHSSASESSLNQSDAFVRGFNSWKHAFGGKQGFFNHQNTQCHKAAEINYKQYIVRTKSDSTVVQVLGKSRNELIKRNREKLIKIISTLHLCARQMISLRGHEEGELGNFIEIWQWTSITDSISLSVLEDSDQNATYLSPLIQNELISLLANQVRQQISNKINDRMFLLMADETRDVSGHEQLSIVVRVVDREVKSNTDSNQQLSLFKEYFLGFIKLDQFNAETLTNEIVRFLSSLNIDLKNCIALCFYGASVMSGKNAGVQALLCQRYIPNGIYVHCHAHKLNPVICDVTKTVPYSSEFYSIINKIYTYFHG